MKIILILIIGILFIESIAKPVRVTCSTTCISAPNTNCVRFFITYNSTNLSAEYCLNAATTGAFAITLCSALPLNLQITGCGSGNNPGFSTGLGCCLMINANNQCFSALQTVVCQA